MHDDARRDAARYRAERDAAARGERAEGAPGAATPANADQRAAYIETSLQQAIRAGEFDDLPGAGKPLSGLGGRLDPDWWIRRKIESEKLGGLGPPALALRAEDAGLTARLDRMHREADVREALGDFNRRIVEARRQLQGGPPVVTRLRDVDAELRAWRERRAERAARSATAESDARAEESAGARSTWRQRRRARRESRRRS